MNNVQVQMADELLIDQKHSKALKYLLESSEIYHQEGWNTLATACLLKVGQFYQDCVSILGRGISLYIYSILF